MSSENEIYELNYDHFDFSNGEGIDELTKFISINSQYLRIKGLKKYEPFKYLVKYASDDVLIRIASSIFSYMEQSTRHVTFDHNKMFTYMWYLLKERKLNVVESMVTLCDMCLNICTINYDVLDDDVKMFYEYFFKDDDVFETGKISGYELSESMTPIYIAHMRLDGDKLIRFINEKDQLNEFEIECIETYIRINPNENTNFLFFLMELEKINYCYFWKRILSFTIKNGNWDSFIFIQSHNPMQIAENMDYSLKIQDAFMCNRNQSDKIWRWLVESLPYSEFEDLIDNIYIGSPGDFLEEKIVDIINMMEKNSNNLINDLLRSLIFYCLSDPRKYLIKYLETNKIDKISDRKILERIFYHDVHNIYDFLLERNLIQLDIETLNIIINFAYRCKQQHKIKELLSSLRYHNESLLNEFILESTRCVLLYLDIEQNLELIEYMVNNAADLNIKESRNIHLDRNFSINFKETIFFNIMIFHDPEHKSSMSFLEKYLKLKEIIGGFDFHQTDSDGHSILHMSVYFDDLELLKYLIEVENMDHYIETNEGLTLIDIAILRICSEPIVSYLLDRLCLVPKESLQDVEIEQNRISFAINTMAPLINNMKYIYSRGIVDLKSYCEKNRDFLEIYEIVSAELTKT